MTEDELAQIIAEAARSVFKQPELAYDPGAVFQNIPGFDSIQAVQFILAVEAAVGILMNGEDVDRMHTMGDLMDVLLHGQNGAATNAQSESRLRSPDAAARGAA